MEKYTGINSEIEFLKKRNSQLKIACAVLAAVLFFTLYFFNQQKILIYDDLSLQYSPGMFVKNEKDLACYYSNDFEMWVIGYKSEQRNRWLEIGWLWGPNQRR